MELMDFSISRNLLDEHFTIVWGSDAYYKYIGYQKEEYATLFQNRLDIYFIKLSLGDNLLNKRL